MEKCIHSFKLLPIHTLTTFSFLSVCIWASCKEIKGRKGDFPMVSVGFCQILQEGNYIWTFFPSFFHFPLFLPPTPAMGPIRLPCPAQPYSQNFLPLSCYQRVFGLRVHTCQMNALTNVWLFEEKLCTYRQRGNQPLPFLLLPLPCISYLQLSSHFYDHVV